MQYTKTAKTLKPNLLVILLGLFSLLVFLMIFSIGLGSVSLDASTVYRALINNLFQRDVFEQTWSNSVGNIVYQLRFPRLLLAAVGGASLALTGVIMQTLTRNALADPYILGVSSGASAGATVSIVLGTFSFVGSQNVATALGAFLGSALASFLVFELSDIQKSYSKTKLVLTGVAVSSIFAALTTLVVTFARNDSLVKNAMFWAAGSLSGASFVQVKIAAGVLSVCFAVAMYYGKDLDIFILGDTLAMNLGVNPQKLLYIMMLINTLLTGTIVSFMGVVGFVGLLVPHIARSFVGTAHRKLLPTSMLLGAILMVITDTLGRTLISPQEIPLGVITALFGGPFFLFLIKKKKYQFGGKSC